MALVGSYDQDQIQYDQVERGARTVEMNVHVDLHCSELLTLQTDGHLYGESMES